MRRGGGEEAVRGGGGEKWLEKEGKGCIQSF